MRRSPATRCSRRRSSIARSTTVTCSTAPVAYTCCALLSGLRPTARKARKNRGSRSSPRVSGRRQDFDPRLEAWKRRCPHNAEEMMSLDNSKEISRMVAATSSELDAWRERDLRATKYKFLYLDGANFSVRR
ncbi:MAG: hypothetical protein FJ108_17315, partial [Deltaproteobacteria bacterium]|nr:hypothetical protein [Deltaproteobacteria bacterium]